MTPLFAAIPPWVEPLLNLFLLGVALGVGYRVRAWQPWRAVAAILVASVVAVAAAQVVIWRAWP